MWSPSVQICRHFEIRCRAVHGRCWRLSQFLNLFVCHSASATTAYGTLDGWKIAGGNVNKCSFRALQFNKPANILKLLLAGLVICGTGKVLTFPPAISQPSCSICRRNLSSGHAPDTVDFDDNSAVANQAEFAKWVYMAEIWNSQKKSSLQAKWPPCKGTKISMEPLYGIGTFSMKWTLKDLNKG